MAQNVGGASRLYLKELFEEGTLVGLTDGQLLERFTSRRGDAAELAFATLVERHGAMVLRTCRGILRDDHEAMDAFQATFLVLVRKAHSLWVRALPGSLATPRRLPSRGASQGRVAPEARLRARIGRGGT